MGKIQKSLLCAFISLKSLINEIFINLRVTEERSQLWTLEFKKNLKIH